MGDDFDEYEATEFIDEGKDSGIYSHERNLVGAYINHLITRFLIILFILTDISLVIAAVSLDENLNQTTIRSLEITSLIFNIIFLIELCLRIFVELYDFYKSWLNILDGAVIVISFIVAVLLLSLEAFGDVQFAKFLNIFRIVRIFLLIRSIRLILMKDGLQKSMRLMVGGNKRRYQKDGYDLDLCYITKRVISMSYPSSGLEASYRNKIEVVAKFLDEKHPNRYKVYNLCSERSYETSHFHDRVERFMIDDHNVPTLKEMIRFAKDAREWLTSDPSNVIAVHCKGGKGRTGTIICVWLLESGECKNAKEALLKFGDRRTNWDKGTTFQGVETPSQSRFVGYFDIIKNELGGIMPSVKTLLFKRIHINSIRGVGNGDGLDFDMKVYLNNKNLAGEYDFKSNSNCKASYDLVSNRLVVDIINCEPLSEEIKVMFYSNHKDVPKYYDDCAFFFSFHTSFIDPATKTLSIQRNELDNPHKSKFWNVYKEDFGVELFFSDI